MLSCPVEPIAGIPLKLQRNNLWGKPYPWACKCLKIDKGPTTRQYILFESRVAIVQFHVWLGYGHSPVIYSGPGEWGM